MAINYAMIIVFLRPYPTSRFAPNVPNIMPPTPILVSKGTKSFYSPSSHEKCFVYKVDSSKSVDVNVNSLINFYNSLSAV